MDSCIYLRLTFPYKSFMLRSLLVTKRANYLIKLRKEKEHVQLVHVNLKDYFCHLTKNVQS